MDLLDARLKIVSLSPKSAKTRTSLSEAPKTMYVALAVSEVGQVIVALYWVTAEKTRMVSEEEEDMRMRWEDGDQRKLVMEVEKAAGRGMTRAVWRERVVRIVSLEGRIVAMKVPSGLDREWAEAVICQKIIAYFNYQEAYISAAVRTAS